MDVGLDGEVALGGGGEGGASDDDRAAVTTGGSRDGEHDEYDEL